MGNTTSDDAFERYTFATEQPAKENEDTTKPESKTKENIDTQLSEKNTARPVEKKLENNGQNDRRDVVDNRPMTKQKGNIESNDNLQRLDQNITRTEGMASQRLDIKITKTEGVASQRLDQNTTRTEGVALQRLDQKITRTEDTDCRLILIGTVGSGKSTTGNSILFQQFFASKFSPNAVTTQNVLHRQDRKCCNKIVSVVDTPGISVTRLTDDHYVQGAIDSINAALKLVYPGPHAFLFIVSIPRFSELDVDLARFIKLTLPTIIDRTIIIFTGQDILRVNNKSLSEFKQELPSDFINFVDQCGKRVYLFDNTFQESWKTGFNAKDNNNQVQKLVEKVQEFPTPTDDTGISKLNYEWNTFRRQDKPLFTGNLRIRGSPLPGTTFLRDDWWKLEQ